MFEVSFDWKPLVEFIKTEHNLQGFLDDPEAYGEKIGEVVENCLQGNAIIETFDGLVAKTLFVAICKAIAEQINKKE